MKVKSVLPKQARVCRRGSVKQFQSDKIPDDQLVSDAREPGRIEYYFEERLIV